MNYWPSAVDPATGIAYGAGIEGCSSTSNKPVAVADVKPGIAFAGGGAENSGAQGGSVFAYDIATGKQIKKTMLDYPNYAGVSLTPGLVWGGTLDGTFAAYDMKTLQQKWSVNIGNAITAPPMTYSVGGREYVAILAGAPSAGSPGVNFGHPELNKPADNMLYVFSL